MTETLQRRIGPWLLTAYGIGVMIGAGIYVLVGAVAAESGIWAPLSFILAGLIAAPTALSYAEFSGRLPEAAGESAYVLAGFRRRDLSVIVGIAIVVAGTISAAAVLRGGAGYLSGVIPISTEVACVLIAAILISVAVIGVLESMALAALFTVIELVGLALVIWAGSTAAPVTAYLEPVDLYWSGIGAGAVLAFFAFIGFEDIVNMAEEVRRPERNIPLAILAALGVTTIIYVLVSWAAVRSVPAAELIGSDQPLALVWQTRMGGQARFLSAIAVFAAANGVLAQIVMAARVLYGLGKEPGPLRIFRQAHPRFGTPVLGTVLVGGAVVTGALLLPISVLAEMTSTVLLSVFILVNLALLLVKRQTPEAAFRVPVIVPVAGLLFALGALIFSLLGGS